MVSMPDVVVLEREHPTDLGRGHPPKLRYPQLDHEGAPGREVGGRVLEHGHLLILRGDVLDGVEHQEHEAEGAVDAGGGHVADRDRDGIRTRLGPQLGCHVRGQLDAMHLDPARAQREGDAARADRELEGASVPRQLGEQVDGRIQRGRLEHRRRQGVVGLRDLRSPQHGPHGRSLPRGRGIRRPGFGCLPRHLRGGGSTVPR